MRRSKDRVLVASAGLLLAPAQQHVPTEIDVAGGFGQSNRRHQARPTLREGSLVEFGMPVEQHDRHGLPQDRIAQELETLVVGRTAVLIRV
jgi:hypothetical protein